jgi:hypothetical protein
MISLNNDHENPSISWQPIGNILDRIIRIKGMVGNGMVNQIDHADATLPEEQDEY